MATKSSDTFEEDQGKYSTEWEELETWHAKDEWTYLPDSKIRLNSPISHKASSELCYRCRSIDLETHLSSLYDPKNNCDLCQIISQISKGARNKELKISLLEARQYVRICAVPAVPNPKHEFAGHLQSFPDYPTRSNPIQRGLPKFLQSGSPLYFKLIKEWIRLCDEGECSGERCCPSSPDRAQMPTRVIDVGDGHTMHLFLKDRNKMSQGAHYVALSHCWGKPLGKQEETTEEQKEPSKEPQKNWNWSTTTSNVERRAQGFLDTELPQTFQDAITVTREIGQRYLWIDSLCIIQDDLKDWATESKKMEAVFKNAYCTIAATSAEDSTKGFLNRPLLKEDSQYVTVPESSHGKVYICTSIDDFEGDVIKGVLNTRAWVLQERALSRRTIHFTKRQTYWECGGGVRCETLTHMKNTKLSFRSDPEFPCFKDRSLAAQIELFQSLFADYSKLDLTYATDRPVAIESLAGTLAEALCTKVHYGIFECFLHRSLIWQLAQNPLTQIDYDKKEPPPKAPPSWSWMAYHGQIQYPRIEFGDCEWDDSVRLVEVKASDFASPEDDGYVLKARVRRLRDCKVKPESVILDEEDNEVGQLYFDTQSENVPPEVRCAIVGRETKAEGGNQIYYVLFVTECATAWGPRKFRRVGMGSIQKRFILFNGQDNTAQIL